MPPPADEPVVATRFAAATDKLPFTECLDDTRLTKCATDQVQKSHANAIATWYRQYGN